MAQVVPDVLEQILVRLDVKDLLRYKSVCKSWNSLISSPLFVKTQLKHSYNNDLNDNKIGHRRIVRDWDPSRFEPLFDDDFYIIGSSNGLVCVYTLEGEILVTNPSTRELRKLQKPECNIRSLSWGIGYNRSFCWGFGYDSSIDDYKVILGFDKVEEDQISFQVLILKSNVWKVIREVSYFYISRDGILCNEALHWIMGDQDNNKVILSFHLSKEEFKEIPQPLDPLYQYSIDHLAMSLGVMEECLCIFNHKCWIPYNMWIMKNYDVKESWGMVGHDCEIKDELRHRLVSEFRHDIPQERSFRLDIHDNVGIKNYLSNPIFVQSLVSPHATNRLKRKSIF